MGAIKKIAIIGGGSWATALTKIFSESGMDVSWYLRSESNVDELIKTGRNPSYLSYLPLPMEHIHPTSNIEEAVRFSDTILFAVPSAYLVSTIRGIEPELMNGKRFLTSIKGVVSEQNQLPTDYLGHRFNINAEQQAVIGGPCHAEEVAMERKTYITIASKNNAFAADMASAIQSHYIKTIENPDPIGVEYAAILKNVIGIACGIAKGLNYGDNFQAVIVSNAMNEIQRFLEAVDQVDRQLFHSAYFGDLLVTTYSEFSRNRTFGQMIGRGYTVQLAQLQMNMVAEGYYAVEGVHALARKLSIEMPIVSAVYRILYNRISPYVEFKLLENKLI